MKTVTIQIGNSDDRLTQREWAQFVELVGHAVGRRASMVHFAGFAPSGSPWQNAAWVVELDSAAAFALRAALSDLRRTFRQDAVAWTEGRTEFV